MQLICSRAMVVHELLSAPQNWVVWEMSHGLELGVRNFVAHSRGANTWGPTPHNPKFLTRSFSAPTGHHLTACRSSRATIKLRRPDRTIVRDQSQGKPIGSENDTWLNRALALLNAQSLTKRGWKGPGLTLEGPSPRTATSFGNDSSRVHLA